MKQAEVAPSWLSRQFAKLQQHPLFGKLLRNIGWNLIGQIAPLLAALLAIPPLLRTIGNERFGLLSIAWMLIGYFSLFDFGLGRALTQVLAQKLALPASGNQQRETTTLIWTGLSIMFGLGLLAGVVLWALSDWMIFSALNVPAEMQQEARQAMPWLALALPSVVLATGLRGVLEAHQAFKLLNLVRIPLGVLTFAAPLLVLPWSTQLPALFAMLCAVRVLSTGLFLWACQRVQQGFWRLGFSRHLLPGLLRFGGWMTLSNIIGPLMVNMDRFLIGAVLSLAAVTYYTTPFEMMTRMLVLPGAVAGVCFPLFAQYWQQENWQAIREVYRKSIRYLAWAMLALSLFVILAAPTLLGWWLSEDFAEQSSTVLRLLALGVLINGLAHLPFALIQGMGAARVTAQFHLLELLFYLPVLYGLLQLWGINGVALAWVLRVSLDAALLFGYAQRQLAAKLGAAQLAQKGPI